MSIDNHARISGQSLHSDPDAEEQWRAQPESSSSEVGWVHAFGLYFLLKFPDEEAFDGALSVGVTRPCPEERLADHRPDVVLGYTGDSGARLANVLLQPDEARELAAHLLDAATTVEKLRTELCTAAGQRADAARLEQALEHLQAAGLTEEEARELRGQLSKETP